MTSYLLIIELWMIFFHFQNGFSKFSMSMCYLDNKNNALCLVQMRTFSCFMPQKNKPFSQIKTFLGKQYTRLSSRYFCCI